MIRRFFLAVLCPPLAAHALHAQSVDSARVQRQYQSAIAAAEVRDLPRAVLLMDSVVHTDSTILNAWWNLGLWHTTLNEPQLALADWLAYHGQDSTDWRVEAKIIQAYQALGELGRRDSALAGLLHHRSVTHNDELKRAEVFCREQALVSGQRVMVMQTFAPAGERRVFYTFYILSEDDRELARFSLGSYDQTTAVARESKEIGPRDRLYHLDFYGPQLHSTLAFYRALPTYDDVRTAVWAAIQSGSGH